MTYDPATASSGEFSPSREARALAGASGNSLVSRRFQARGIGSAGLNGLDEKILGTHRIGVPFGVNGGISGEFD